MMSPRHPDHERAHNNIKDNEKAKYVIGMVVCTIITMLISILVFGGLRFVAFDEYAIAYSGLTQEPNENILTEGTHWLSVDTSLYVYSRVVKPIQLNNFKCLAKDGIVININIKFQFQVRQETLIDVFFQFGEEHNLIRHMTDIAKDSLRDTCGKFFAREFASMRSDIQTKFEIQLSNDFTDSNAYTTVNSLQLENYSFPPTLNDAIDDKQQALQDKDKAQQEREGELTIIETERLIAEVQAEKTLIKSQAEIDSIILEANTTANTVYEVWNNRGITYKLIMDGLEMTAPDFINEYLTTEVLGSSQNIITNY